MKQTVLLWLAAVIITLASAYYQRVTGPTYPLKGTASFIGEEIKFKFERTHSGYSSQQISFSLSDPKLNAELIWKRYKTDDEWTHVKMEYDGKTYHADLPAQPSAGKLMYQVSLSNGASSLLFPQKPVVIRYKGDVPLWILIPHVFCMFMAMLLSTRTGLELLQKEPKLKKYTIATFVLLIPGGFVFGPIVQHYAFGAFWTGFPYGFDLTDNKTLIALIGWLVAAFALYLKKNEKFWIGFASVLMLIIFLIPHSALGSELDYNKLDREKKKSGKTEIIHENKINYQQKTLANIH